MRKTYLLKLATVKKADIDKAISRAKRLRDESFLVDLLKHTVGGATLGGLYGVTAGAGLGGAAGFTKNTRPSEKTGTPPYGVDGIIGTVAGGFSPTVDLKIGNNTITVPRPRSQAEAYDLYGTLGYTQGAVNGALKALKPSLGLGAGLGALISLLTYSSRRDKAIKQLKELGIE